MTKIKTPKCRQEELRRRVLRPKFERAYRKKNLGKEISFLRHRKTDKYENAEVNSAWIAYLNNNP